MTDVTAEMFEQEMLRRLRASRARYPDMQPQDTVKFVFQGMLGVGHLLATRETVTEYVRREMSGLTPDPEEPLTETLSPFWCRLSLRRAMAEGIAPETVAGLMLASEDPRRFTRGDAAETLRRLARADGITPPEETDFGRVRDETWLPSHSDVYREKYHPAYRVISADWISRLPAVCRIAGKQKETRRMLVTLDGPCATGKTTLARKLGTVFQANVLHTDDFVIPHRQKTPERLAVPGGNCDADRLAAEVTEPWKRGETVRYRRYDFMADRLLPEEELPDSRILIMEGSYCNLPVLRKDADVRLYLDASWETREARLRRRESPESLKRFYDRWIPLEDAYFAAYGLPDRDCVVLA